MKKERALEILLNSCNTSIEEFMNGYYKLIDNNVVYVAGYWGTEGGGEDAYRVYGILDGNESALICFYGRYSSWSDTEWNTDFVFVEPKEEIVIKYYPIKGQ